MTSLRESLSYQPVELSFGTSGLRGLAVDMTDLECYINTIGFLKFAAETDGLMKGSTVYFAGDLRESTPRILAAVAAAVVDAGHQPVNLGLIPTPALALYALSREAIGIMVTGSHIPADRNGIKFYKRREEVLKEDEPAIKAAVAAERLKMYEGEVSTSPFTATGALRTPPALPQPTDEAAQEYQQRYQRVFGPDLFRGKKIVLYQHSAVSRDLFADLLANLGAGVVAVGRSDVFVPIDSENVTPKDQAYFRELAQSHPDAFAIVSVDGDSDRPFVVDERGTFHRGDVLGALVAVWLGADFAAFTASTSDAVDEFLDVNGIAHQHTKIGSPYVVSAMQAAHQAGKRRPVGWEVNGGFMTGAEFRVRNQSLAALPTRDAILPILSVLAAAVDAGQKVSDLFDGLPKRSTSAGLIDNFPTGVSQAMVRQFQADTVVSREALAAYFGPQDGFGAIQKIDTLDGIRIFFAGGDIAHLRPSGNAPQLRIYSVANTQERADAIVQLALAEPDGIFRRMERAIAVSR